MQCSIVVRGQHVWGVPQISDRHNSQTHLPGGEEVYRIYGETGEGKERTSRYPEGMASPGVRFNL